MEWYAQIATDVAGPYIVDLGQWLALLFFLGFVPGVVSLMFGRGKRKST